MRPLDSLLNALADAPAASPQAQQLRRGFRTLRFEPALEAEFREELNRDFDRRLRAIALLVLLLWGAFALADSLRIDLARVAPEQIGLWHQLRAMRLGVLTFLGVATLVAWTQGFGRWGRAVLVVGALMIEWGGAYGTTIYLRLQAFQMMEVMLLLVGGLFLPIGLTVRQTALLALAAVAGITCIGLLSLDGAQQSRFVYVSWLLAVTALLAGFGAYFREYAQREQFLLRAELGWQATHDVLTGLANRRLFGRELERLLRLARRENQPLALAVLDVDWFKRFNDLYGHPSGDDALQQVAQVLARGAARPLDLAARLGGEELAVLLYGVDASAARRHCEALLQRVRDLRIPHADGASHRLTLSLGCSMARPDDTPEQLYHRADRLLYDAKRAGRDRGAFDGVADTTAS